VILVVLAVALLFKIIDWYASPHTFRLVAHYSAKAKLARPIDTRQLYPEDLKRLEEGDPAVFTEAGLFLYEQGSGFYQADEQEAVIAFRDWRGRRRWAVTLPASSFRGFFASPNGRYLATYCGGRGSSLFEVWRDGKSVYEWMPDESGSDQVVRIDNDGQLSVWYDGKLSVIQDGEVIASNLNLPTGVYTEKSNTDYRVAPDGTAMAGLVHTIRRSDADYSRPDPGPSLDYIALDIKGNKIVATHQLFKKVPDEGWRFLPGGDLEFADGTLYTRNGQRRSSNGWVPFDSFIGAGTSDLWHGDAIIQGQATQVFMTSPQVQAPTPTPLLRVYNPRTGLTWQLPNIMSANDSVSSDFYKVYASGNGRYALVIIHNNDYPPTMAGRLARTFKGSASMRKLFHRIPATYTHFKLYDQFGKLKAQMICPVTDTGYGMDDFILTTPVFKVGKRQYAMVSYALSQDGKNLVVLAQSLTGHDRLYLHFAW